MVLLITGALSTVTAVQSFYWTSDLTLFAHAVLVDRNNPQGLALLAGEFAKRGQKAAAVEFYERALAKDPDSWRIQTIFGITLIEFSNWQKAEEHLQRATRLRPGDATAYFYLGLAQNGQGEREAAERSLKHAMALLPSVPPRMHQALGEVLQAEGKLNEARGQFEAALVMDPRPAVPNKSAEEDRSGRGNSPSPEPR
jgi:Tfp pilus assembly protein PilF